MLSPRTQAMSAPPGPDQAKALFEQGFSDMAHQVLLNKLPQISQDIVTFQVLNVDAERGTGTGTFVLSRNGQALYVPVVLVENQIKPLDFLYYKGMNRFVPLTKDWIDQIDRQSVTEMGSSVKEPKTLSRDVDVRNTIVPPVTGRYSYAADLSDAHRVFERALAENTVVEKTAFLQILKTASEPAKRSVVQMFEKHPALLKQAVAAYGRTQLHDALFVEHGVSKTAGQMSRQGVLYIADKDTTPAEFKEVFGPDAPTAYAGVKIKGYHSRDDRPSARRIMMIPEIQLTEVKDTGVYELYKMDGTSELAFLLANPHDIFRDDRNRKIPPRNIRFRPSNVAPADPLEGGGQHYEVPGKSGKPLTTFAETMVGVTESGKLIDSRPVVARPRHPSSSNWGKHFKESPALGDKGFFISKLGRTYIGTVPFTVKAVHHDSNGVRRIEVTNDFATKVLVTDPHSSYTRLTSPTGTNIVYLPADFTFVKVGERLDPTELAVTSRDIERAIREEIGSGTTPFYKIKKANYQGWVFTDDRTKDYGFTDALRKCAIDLGVRVEDAAAVLKLAEQNGAVEFTTVDEVTAMKIAAAADAAMGEDAQAQLPPEAMMPPPQPSPVDMAVAEMQQNLMQQAMALQQQQAMLQQVQMRAQQIGGGDPNAANVAGAAFYGGPQAMMGAPVGGPMDPTMGGAQPGMQPGMDPNAPQGMQQPGMQPGMDPNAQPGMEQGGDPNAQPQGPAAFSTEENLQVNPQFMAAAADLEGQEYFDSAAVSTLAQSQTLRELVSGYIPTLEKSLDNIGRINLALWMNELTIKEEVGHITFTKLENNLRLVFKGLGDAVIKLNETNQVMPETLNEFSP